MSAPTIYLLDDFDTEDYKLIALHSSRKDEYKIAYFINAVLNLFLERRAKDIAITTDEGNGSFVLFEYEDSDHHVLWQLISNKTFLQPKNQTESLLFSGIAPVITRQGYLFPDLKTVDYLIKIENTNHQFDIAATIEKLNSLKIISTAYEIKPEKIKSKQNLIF
jgi:hypothetical protein